MDTIKYIEDFILTDKDKDIDMRYSPLNEHDINKLGRLIQYIQYSGKYKDPNPNFKYKYDHYKSFPIGKLFENSGNYNNGIYDYTITYEEVMKIKSLINQYKSYKAQNKNGNIRNVYHNKLKESHNKYMSTPNDFKIDESNHQYAGYMGGNMSNFGSQINMEQNVNRHRVSDMGRYVKSSSNMETNRINNERPQLKFDFIRTNISTGIPNSSGTTSSQIQGMNMRNRMRHERKNYKSLYK